LSHSLVEAYVNKFRDSLSVQVNTKIDDLTDLFPVYLIDAPVEELTEYVLSSIRFYQGKPYKYVQLIIRIQLAIFLVSLAMTMIRQS